MTIALAPLVALSAVGLLLLLVSHASAHVVLSRRPPRGGARPPVSILKPLKGMDAGLDENLRAIVEQQYPAFEILFGVEDTRDPAYQVAERLRREHPAVPIRIVVCPPGRWLNPKVNTLAILARHARHDLLLISDSNVRPRPDYLDAMVAELSDERVGLVSSLLAGAGGEGLGARLENLHLGSQIATAVCGAAVVTEHPCVIGKSMLLRRSDLDRLGGFRKVRNVLAEDYVLARMFKDGGFELALSPHVLPVINDGWPLERFINRHVRWSQMRRRLLPSLYLAEPLSNPLPLFVLTAAVADMSGASSAALACGLAAAVKIAADALLTWRLSGRRPSVADLVAIPPKDAIVLGVWIAGALKRTVDWRGHRMFIGPGSRLSAAGTPPAQAAESDVAVAEAA